MKQETTGNYGADLRCVAASCANDTEDRVKYFTQR